MATSRIFQNLSDSTPSIVSKMHIFFVFHTLVRDTIIPVNSENLLVSEVTFV